MEIASGHSLQIATFPSEGAMDESCEENVAGGWGLPPCHKQLVATGNASPFVNIAMERGQCQQGKPPRNGGLAWISHYCVELLEGNGR